MMMRSLLPGALLLALLATGCSKEPGEGGKAEIRGVVHEQRYNSSSPVGEPYPKAEQRVYIVYGNGTYPDDDTRTGPNGEFRFPWLRKGQYRIYVISECSTCPSGEEAVFKDVEISGRREVVNMGTLLIRNY
jgi:hypothetical protein